jgi:5-methylcytosine-specific restriction endonuclease McrA
MTSDKRAKRSAREFRNRNGGSYAAARRQTRARKPVFRPGACANCLGELPDEIEGLFCSELCRRTAETIRYWRRIRRDGRLLQPDVKEALQTMVAHLLAGGYNRQARRLPTATRDAVWARDAGRCASCGKPGEEIDHINGDSGNLDNLQLLCKDCHHAKTATRMTTPATAEQLAAIRKLEDERVKPEVPRLLCDDDVAWPTGWQSLKKMRRQEFVEEAQNYDIERREFASWSEFIEELHRCQDDALGDGDLWPYEEDTDYLRRLIAADS